MPNDDMERARAVVAEVMSLADAVPDELDRCLPAVLCSVVADAFEAVRQEERERCAGIAKVIAEQYPKDVFPDDSDSLDARAARFARHLMDVVEIAVMTEDD